MTAAAPRGPERPRRRRESWSLEAIVENVAGRPLSDFQDPDRPAHPYVRARRGRNAPLPAEPAVRASAIDPVDLYTPPLVGAVGRAAHDPGAAHHQPTLARLAQTPTGPAGPGPSRRPERVYLHYLLLHLDRLETPALEYLRHSVEEELDRRAPPPVPVTPSRPEGPAPAPGPRCADGP
ncbi:MAG: hypothetical protein ACYCPN_04540 [Thermoplasmata archaeon]